MNSAGEKNKINDKGRVKTMKSKAFLAACVSVLLAALVFSQSPVREKDLPDKYQDFLKLTRYIMHEKEKEAFLKLTNDRERDVFIDLFWGVRDPTPGTPENEYKQEHIKRFLYASKHFKRNSPREGWMTDMGRIHILLGQPVSIERFYGTIGIYPCEVWSYYGDTEKGLPPHFVIVFFQRGGTGEFKLYDPVSDGPAALMVHSKGFAIEDYESMYETLREMAPTLADVSLSLIPSEIPFNYQPSPRNTILLANIAEVPKKAVNPSYATHFLSYRGIVSTEHMTNMVESETSTALIPDPIMGLNFLHFSVVPKKISIDYYEENDQYYCNFALNVSLRRGEEIVFQYTKDFPLYFAPQELERLRANGVAIEDSFPVIEGDYRLTILLQNSVAKEFSIFEQEISIPEATGRPRIVGPFLGYGFQDYQSNVHIPFKIVNRKLIVDPKNTFAASDQVSFLFDLMNVSSSHWRDGEVRVNINGLRKENPVGKSMTFPLKDHPYRRSLSISHSIPAREFTPDYYEMKVTWVGKNGELIDETKATFIVSSEEAVGHPIIQAKVFQLSNNFLFFYMLAHQYAKTGDLEKAEETYERAYRMNPEYKRGVVEYANFLLTLGKFTESLEMVGNVRDQSYFQFDYFLIRGKALLGLSRFREAIDSLVEGNKIYNSDTGLLNALGFCYYRTGQKERALEVLRASLNLNSSQDAVRRLIEEIERSGGTG